MPPRKIWIWRAVLGTARLAMFVAIHFRQSHDAQWQLSYLPLWIIDFPISILYFKCPIPLAEGIVGPSWWFLIPILFWRLFRRSSSEKK
jgi:hypothetical protein